MKQYLYKSDLLLIVILTLVIPLVLFGCSLLKGGQRNLGVLETIHGIPYPVDNGSTVILEDMAHTDLFLREPVLAKQAMFTITFDPGNAEAIDIGVRDNEFWLSYIKYPLYRIGVDTDRPQTKTITIPLTTALADTNRSIDMMLFTEASRGMPEWRIQDFHASVEFDMPTVSEAKAYIKSVLVRERVI